MALKNFDVRICCSKKIRRATNFSNAVSFDGYHPILQVFSPNAEGNIQTKAQA